MFRKLNHVVVYVFFGVVSTGCMEEIRLCMADKCIASTIVETSKGAIRGVRVDGVNRFYSINYSKPPVGENRWKSPQPVESWSGVKNATLPALGGCNQWATPTAVLPPFESEDCLYLNIWAPSSPGPHPVMVFFHGGWLLLGSGNEPSNKPVKLVENEQVIVVTVSYRLGALGFLSLPELTAESPYAGSGNFGLLDQQAALQWVKDEISAFGGDSSNITLFGESAGGLSVCAHLASPLSNNLFQRAIIQSGPCTSWSLKNQAEAHQAGIALANRFGCKDADTRLQCLRNLSVDNMKEALDIKVNGAFKEDPSKWAYFPHLTQDGYFLNDTLENMLASSSHRQEVIIGVVENEGSLFEVYRNHPEASEYQIYLQERYSEKSAGLLKYYPMTNFSNTGDALAAIRGDEFIVCPTVYLSDLLSNLGYSVYQYEFTERTDSLLRTMSIALAGKNAPDLGTFHSTELPFVFGQSAPTGTLENPGQYSVVGAMQSYWAQFAASGDPNSTGYPVWPVYHTSDKRYLTMGQGFPKGSMLHADTCDYWNKQSFNMD